MKEKVQLVSIVCMLFAFGFTSCSKKCATDNLVGAYSDAVYKQEIQTIPGKLQCEYYDFGGEGIAYHDTDTSNNGSGNLNKGEGYLNTYRIDEAVDISYTKFHDNIDNSTYNFVEPKEGQLYIGWTEPGEWTKYTIDVKTTGVYQTGIMYTANADGQISLSLNGKDITGPLDIVSTYVDADTIAWRQWHHWNYMKNITEVKLEKGVQILTLHTLSNGQMNYDFLEFALKEN